MTRLVWNETGKRLFEIGVDRGVLYPEIGYPGVAWNGLVAVRQKPVGGTATPYYIDGIRFLNDISDEEFTATIEAFTYPDEFAYYEGLEIDASGLGFDNQGRKPFGLVYRTRIGNDVNGDSHGYKLHLVYQATAAPTQRDNQTINQQIDPLNFSWDVDTVPLLIPDKHPTAHIVLDSTVVDPGIMTIVEGYLFGSTGIVPTLLLPLQLIQLINNWVPPAIYVPYIWDLTGGLEFPDEAANGDVGIDFNTDDVWRNDEGTAVAAFPPYMWNLTGVTDFPLEALYGDLGYNSVTGEVWRNTGGDPSASRTAPVTFKGTYVPIPGAEYPAYPVIGDAWLIDGHLWIWLDPVWYDYGEVPGLS